MSGEVNNVSVVGAGMMGHGIAQIAAMAGFKVNLVDVSKDALDTALGKIKWSLQKFVEKGKIKKEDAEIALRRINPSLDLQKSVENADFIIEAVPEDLDLKKRVFAQVDRSCPKHAIIATNTSSLSITEISKATRRPERVVGLHFFYPA